MATLKQIDAARTNGAKSTGPKTPETKAKSAANSLKHGFTSKTVVLQNENPAQFQELLQSYLDDFHPGSQAEMDAVSDLAASRWRLRRIWNIETAAIDLAMDRQAAELAKEIPNVDEPTRIACAFQKLADESRTLSLLSRYETRLRKAYDQALQNLRKLQADRAAAEAANSVPNEPAAPSPCPQDRPKPSPEPPRSPVILAKTPPPPDPGTKSGFLK